MHKHTELQLYIADTVQLCTIFRQATSSSYPLTPSQRYWY